MGRPPRNANFRYLWAAQTINRFGYDVATVVIPLFAVQTLRATPGHEPTVDANAA
ncbi:hypothetical protein GA0070608_2164 [Micromonospora peucetia]|uniref:Uncharacterized protein n=1 Tax=Micromonospora peucetia TaxID=47871 RepID=A0A1C6V099_9ACTN|nr:hypothetical protein GA0070608_2164 [Micromonospora peucetia]